MKIAVCETLPEKVAGVSDRQELSAANARNRVVNDPHILFVQHL